MGESDAYKISVCVRCVWWKDSIYTVQSALDKSPVGYNPDINEIQFIGPQTTATITAGRI